MDVSASKAEVCWCDSTDFASTPHADYLLCRSCGTAKLRAGLETGQDPVTDEQSHLYGETYWNEHMEQYGYPTLVERAQGDLAERAQYWLAHILKYHLPTGRSMEVGCAHGGFVKLMSAAGFEAHGIEMSPGIIAKANHWFGIDLIRGPIEHSAVPLGAFDVVLMFDVIEHFANPLATMSEILKLVVSDGLVVLQTPNYDDVCGASWHQFKSPEHTFLFSIASIKRFLAHLGFEYVTFEPPIFAGDMFVFASRRPLQVHNSETIVNALADTPDGRLVLAMQDLYRQVQALRDPGVAFGPRTLGAALFRAIPRALARRFRSRQ